MLFHKPLPSISCIVIFFVLILLGGFKLVFWHMPRFFILGRRDAHRFIKEVGKSADQLACACAFGGRHDETISNRAGRIFQEKKFNSPWWVILTKKLTDKWDPPKNGKSHIEDSIEPLRPDIDEGA